MTEPLRAAHEVSFTYERSVGGATERFLRGLAEGEIIGSVAADGTVTVPPADHDAATGQPTTAYRRVAEEGVVRSWTWVDEPTDDHPLDHPFALALVQLDGADTSLLHVVDVDAPGAMRCGLRVRADWRPARVGSIRDLRAFVTHEARPAEPADPPAQAAVTTDVRVSYGFEPGVALSSFYRALGEGRIEAGRCPSCTSVYVPARPRCPRCGSGPLAAVAVEGTGTITAVAVVHLPVPGMDLELPFAWGRIRLDGVDVAFPHLLGGAPPDRFRVGDRVTAVWAPDDARPASWEAIVHFGPEEP